LQFQPGSSARHDVLAFYRDMPFNFHESASEAAERIAKMNICDVYPVLERFLRPATRVLEVGCGTGWLSNAIAYHHHCQVLGIDFNRVAIERSKEVEGILGSGAEFLEADLFSFETAEKFRLIISLGVLHHTSDCLGGVRHICRTLLAPKGHLFLGLYHRYGRSPFLQHFEDLKRQKLSEENLFVEYKRLHGDLHDEQHILSWFRDQVLHPYETQHTIKELLPIFEEENMELRFTSINDFAKAWSIDELLDLERAFEEKARRDLLEGKYNPGFFVVLARKLDSK